MNDVFNTLADFFNALTNEQKIFLGILSLIVFALGVVVGWIIQGMKTRRFKKELLVLRKDRDEYEMRYNVANVQQKALAKELEVMSREKVDALDRIQGLERDLVTAENALLPLQQNKEALEASNQGYAATIESLNGQVVELQTQNEQLLAAPPVEVQVGNAGNMGAGAGAGNVGTSNESLLNAYIAMSENRFQHLEEQMFSMAEENATLRQGSAAPAEDPGYVTHQPVMPTAVETDANGEPLMIRADTTEPGVRTGERGAAEIIVQTNSSVQMPPVAMGTFPAEGQDDLTRIKDIGPFMQAKLNEHDIYSYAQIANWSEADIITYTELIGYLPGIIQRDDWVGQAKDLASASVADPEPYHAPAAEAPDTTGASANQDNLKVIEGIGPKIETVLKASGVRTLDELADTDPDHLRAILDGAGSQFNSHNPQSWPAQAGLAADGKMKELKAWQAELKGGH
ncbi:MAG: putative flap endonuclease-1-like 5' DNA nuclease [Neolewinella sp.]|jgi:predicted flap endonuclease-1-like 5' DNA nuclease/uncharacterized membrane protein YciS (DUF1049 family)